MSAPDDDSFVLDPRLAADTIFVADRELSRVLLMDDARFPWLILVPRRVNAVELDDLSFDDQTQLLREVGHAMALLRSIASCGKFNIGALGNIVRQLHVHVVARRKNDAAWPGPVWGSGLADRYGTAVRDSLLDRLRAVP